VTPVHWTVKGEFGNDEYSLNYRGGNDDIADKLLDIKLKKSANPLTTYTITAVYDRSVEEGQAPDVKATIGYSYRYVSLSDFEVSTSKRDA